jgi:hypothetical protein
MINECLNPNDSAVTFSNSAALVEEDLPQIFDGVIVYVNGYTDPPIHGNLPRLFRLHQAMALQN